MAYAAQRLARQVLRFEADASQDPAALAMASERAYLRLRARLTGLIGVAGYNALFARALRLAQTDDRALERITLDARFEMSLLGVRDYALAHGADPSLVATGLTSLFARAIGLLITFIGEDLALRLTREAWPEMAKGETVAEE